MKRKKERKGMLLVHDFEMNCFQTRQMLGAIRIGVLGLCWVDSQVNSNMAHLVKQVKLFNLTPLI
jgi:hypothetical protein